MRRVLVDAPHDRTNQHELVHDRREPGQQLANVDARHGRGDRPEPAADLGRSAWLEVVEVEVGRPTRQEDHDDRLVRMHRAGHSLGLEQPRQRQSAKSQAADLEERPAGQAAASHARLAMDYQHDVPLIQQGNPPKVAHGRP